MPEGLLQGQTSGPSFPDRSFPGNASPDPSGRIERAHTPPGPPRLNAHAHPALRVRIARVLRIETVLRGARVLRLGPKCSGLSACGAAATTFSRR